MIKLFLTTFVLGLLINACSTTGKPQPLPETPARSTTNPKHKLEKIYLDEVPSLFTAGANRATALEVKVNLPSGAYTFDHIEVQMRGNVIELTPFAKFDPNVMGIQMIIPITQRVELGPLAAGEYTLRFVGRADVRKSKLEVR